MPPDTDTPAETHDRVKWMWFGALALLVLMVGTLWLRGPVHAPYSTVRASHILIKCNLNDPADCQRAVDRLKEIKQRIDKGESFSKLAKQYSEDPQSAARGGDLGPAKKGAYVDEFEKYAWNGPVGQVSDIIRTSLGYHLILIEERNLSEVDAHLKMQEEKLREQMKSP